MQFDGLTGMVRMFGCTKCREKQFFFQQTQKKFFTLYVVGLGDTKYSAIRHKKRTFKNIFKIKSRNKYKITADSTG